MIKTKRIMSPSCTDVWIPLWWTVSDSSTALLEFHSSSHNTEVPSGNNSLALNRLPPNVSKTSFVLFSPVNKPLKNVTILINKQAISQKDYVKYLGVLIDSRLTFQQHISAIKKKISRTIGIMYKLRNFVSKKYWLGFTIIWSILF